VLHLTAFLVITDPGGKIEHTSESRWGLGQVMAVATLAAQLNEMVEYYRLHRNESESQRSSFIGRALLYCGVQSRIKTTSPSEVEIFDVHQSETNV